MFLPIRQNIVVWYTTIFTIDFLFILWYNMYVRKRKGVKDCEQTD